MKNRNGSAPTDMGLATGSSVVTTLERVWDAVRANYPELPAVVMVTGSALVGPPRWGHTRADGWTDRTHQETRDGATTDLRLGEMFVAGETLARGASFTLETILHEAAHVLAKVRGVKDTSRQNRWHNQRFRALAEELGLEYPKESAHPQIGFSECLMTPGTKEEYAGVMEDLDRAIRLTVPPEGILALSGDDGGGDAPAGGKYIHHGGRSPRAEGAGSTTNNLKAICGCPTPRIIRASRKVLAEGEIVCLKCREPFKAETPEPSDEDD